MEKYEVIPNSGSVAENKRFVCPVCGSLKVNQVSTRIVEYTTCTGVDFEGNIMKTYEYQRSAGDIERYECDNCSTDVKDENGRLITTSKELAEWIEKNCVKLD